MRIHKPLATGVVQALEYIFIKQKHADKVLEQLFKSNPKWGARDRAFVAENTYDIVRWWRLVNYCGNNPGNSINKGSLWHLLGVWLTLKRLEIPEWTEFKNINAKTVFKLQEQAAQQFTINQSIPDWLNEIGIQQLPNHWESEITALNQPAQLFIRVNTLKTSIAQLVKEFQQEKIEVKPLTEVPNAILIHKRLNLFSTNWFKAGYFEMQDAASQMVPLLLDPKPGMKVIDACAGAGGKSLQLAALMQNKGLVVSMDTEQWKLEELKRRAKRAGAFNIQTQLISDETLKKLHQSADRLLLDVPCSGLGVLKRNPDSKWKLSAAFLEQVQQLQEKILSQYATLLKPGGLMVYATCSILPSENSMQVEKFLNANTNYQLVSQQSILASKSGFDGFYMALIKKH